jgi:hypothetical protein
MPVQTMVLASGGDRHRRRLRSERLGTQARNFAGDVHGHDGTGCLRTRDDRAADVGLPLLLRPWLTIQGEPKAKHISTSYVERQNLTMRMHIRRFTRLTNAFSKKAENHAHSVALHFMYHNFAKIHQTLRVTPAMEAGVSDHVWSIEEVVGLLG